MDREKQVYNRRRLASTLEGQQEELKKNQEGRDKIKPQNVDNAYGSTCKLVTIMICVLLLFLLLALVWSLLIGTENEQNYYKLGLSHYKTGQYESALWWFLKELEIQEARGDKASQLNARVNVANAYRLLGKTDQVTPYFDTALHLAQQTGDLHGQMEVYFNMGDMQMEPLHSPRTAIQNYKHALALAGQLDRHEEGLAYNRLGRAYFELGEYETALEWDKKHLKASKESGDKKKQVTAHANMGDAYRKLHKLDQATSHFDTALQLAQQTGDQHGKMQVYFWIGEMQREQLHSPRTAIQYYDQHLALAKQLGDRHEEGLVYNRLGRANHEAGEYGTALEWHQEDLKLSQETGDKESQITAHINIAGSYKSLGKLDQARSHYQLALTIAMETGNKQEYVDLNCNLGDLHREQLHEPQKSLKYYTEMLALARELKSKDKERLAYNRLGLACGDMQDNEAALEWHQKNLKMSQEDEDKAAQMIAHHWIARSYQALGKLDLARSHYLSAMAIAMETGDKQQQEDITKRLASL